jgi:hypothetical protein
MKHFLLSLFLFLSITGVSLVYETPGVGAVCFWDWSGDCGSPDEIPFCQGNECTLEWGVVIAEWAVEGRLSQETIVDFVTRIVLYFMSFVSIIAVAYVIYAGFQLMISGWDEEKAKKTKKIITYVIAGILLMWIAYWLVRIVIDALL